MALKKKVFSPVEIPEGSLVQKVTAAPVMEKIPEGEAEETSKQVAAEVKKVIEHATIESPPAPINAYPFRLIERWESEDKREIRKLEACPYGGNGIVIKTSTRFLDPAGNVTACSEAISTIPGVSMRTFDGDRRGKKEL